MVKRKKPLKRYVGIKRRYADSDRKSDSEIANLISIADTCFSKYIRNKYADENGIVSCFTCDTLLKISQITLGHFIGRKNKSVRWHIHNGRPQCIECNNHKGGNIDIFRERLEKEIPGIVDKLTLLSKRRIKLTAEYLNKIINKYGKKK